MKFASIAWAIICITLVSCGQTAPTKSVAPPSLEIGDNSTAIHGQANFAFNQWQQDPTVEGLIKTAELYQKAYELQPHDVNIQKGHYVTIVILAMLNLEEHLESIKSYYDELNPAVQLEVASPGRLVYLQQSEIIESPKPKMAILRAALHDYPQDAFLWAEYSDLARQINAPRFAASVAKQAHKLYPTNPEHSFQIAEALNQAILMESCRYDERALAKRAASYYTEAAKINATDIRYVSGSSEQYLRLGLIPLAYAQAQKAASLGNSEMAQTLLTTTSYLLKKYEDSESHANKLVQDYDNSLGYLFMAALAANKGNWVEASEHFAHVAESSLANTSEKLSFAWLKSIVNNSHAIALTDISPTSNWETEILNYLNDPQIAIDELEKKANNRCEQTEAHFYRAMRHWANGDMENTLKHLKLSRKKGAVAFVESIWAQALISGLTK